LEDSEKELLRRMTATCMHHGITADQVDGWLYFDALGRDAGKLMVQDDKGRLTEGALAAAIAGQIVRHKIDLVTLDPFVKSHAVTENINDAIDAVAQVLTDLAAKYNIAVDAPHHVSKGTPDPGNANRGRGASAFVDAARLVYTLTPMSVEEAKTFGVPEDERFGFVRMDKGKVNIAPPARKATWFKLVGVHLGNGTQIYDKGDSVQTVEPWSPPDTWADLDSDLLNRMLDDIDKGIGGNRYSDAAPAKERAAWHVVQKYAPDKTKAQCREIIRIWIKNDVLESRDYEDADRRETVKGLFVNVDKRPK
jgi:hypothetical protein